MPRVVDHTQRRHEIVSALWAVIYDRGIDGVTLQAVADEAGISVGRIQHYFESKQHLIRAGALEIVTTAERAHHTRIEQSDPRSELVALLTQPVPTSTPFRVATAVWYAYVARAVSDPWIEAFLAETSHGTVQEVARLLHELGVDRSGDDAARNRARYLVALSNGIAQSVFLGVMDADEAIELITGEIHQMSASSAGLDGPGSTRNAQQTPTAR
ncbi:MAG TPA: TetR/AcrR family transcriptional regulator [Propionibacteriaceae bacterium]